ncbi:TetR family transcriptional regulator [Mycobacterium sp. ITM-2017-0098]|nr:TetR family transcriptional regulator [Mycobacterium sp. ITM-2017-0098]
MAQRRNVDDDISETTLDLLRAKGPRSVTVEAVSARSGIAKTTIYRRHRDRREMLSLALSQVTAPEPLAPDTEAPDRLRWVIKHAVRAVEAGIGFGGFAALLTDDDPEFTALFRKILLDQRAELESVITAGASDGALRSDVDAATLIDAMVGTLIAERARTGRVAPDWETRLFDLFWPAVRA